MDVRWLRAALKNLDEIADYIALGNPRAASKVVAVIWESTQRLADFPGLGRPGRVDGTRELVVTGTPYVVPYRVKGQKVEILRVLHGARKWPSHFGRKKARRT
jgi:toxin ParE1/3/4